MSAVRVVLGIAGVTVLVLVMHAWLGDGVVRPDELPAPSEHARDAADEAHVAAASPLAPLLERDARTPIPMDVPAVSLAATPHQAVMNRAVPVAGTRPDPLSGITVFGNLHAADGQPCSAIPSTLVFDDAGVAPVTLEIRSDNYAISHLTAGWWHVVWKAPGHRPVVLDIELAPDVGLVKLDLALERGHEWNLDIKALTPDGRALLVAAEEELSGRLEESFDFRLRAIATPDKPQGTVPALSERAYDPGDWGTFVVNGDDFSYFEVEPDEWGALGTLHADGAPPLFVSLVLGAIVLQTQRVEAGAAEVVFTLPVASLLALFGGVRVRVVSAETRLVPLEVTAGLTGAGAMGAKLPADPDGSFAWQPVLPGLRKLSIHAPGYELWDGDVWAPVGGLADLGTVELTPATTITGRVVGTDGEPVVAEVRALRDDTVGPLGSAFDSGAGKAAKASVQRDGHFEITGLGRHRYRVVVSSKSWAALPVLVDLRHGDVEDVCVPVAAGALVRLRARWLPAPPCDVRLSTADGVLISEWAHWCGDSTWTGRLPSGAFSVTLLRDGLAFKRIPFDVAEEDLVVELAF